MNEYFIILPLAGGKGHLLLPSSEITAAVTDIKNSNECIIYTPAFTDGISVGVSVGSLCQMLIEDEDEQDGDD